MEIGLRFSFLRQMHQGAVPSLVNSQHVGPAGLLRSFCAYLACRSCKCVGFLWVTLLPTTVQTHSRYSIDSKVAVGAGANANSVVSLY